VGGSGRFVVEKFRSASDLHFESVLSYKLTAELDDFRIKE